MTEAVPAASVFPTRTRLGDTQTGNAGGAVCVPTPPRVTLVGELVALLATVALPVTLWATVGVNATISVADWLGVKMVPDVMPLVLNPVPVAVTPEIVTFELPLLVSVVLSEPVLPTFTFPKSKLVGLVLSRYVAAFTVSVAALLLMLPAELLTTTVNCAPLSAVVVAGVA